MPLTTPGHGSKTAKAQSQLVAAAKKAYDLTIDPHKNTKDKMVELLQRHVDNEELVCEQCTDGKNTSCDIARHKFSKEDMVLPPPPNPQAELGDNLRLLANTFGPDIDVRSGQVPFLSKDLPTDKETADAVKARRLAFVREMALKVGIDLDKQPHISSPGPRSTPGPRPAPENENFLDTDSSSNPVNLNQVLNSLIRQNQSLIQMMEKTNMAPTAGRVAVSDIAPNRWNVRFAGVSNQPILHIQGDPEMIVMSKMTKKITTNATNKGEAEVWKQAAWPQLFCSSRVVMQRPDHNGLTLLQYFCSWIMKLLSEMPDDFANTEFENKMQFLSVLAEYSQLMPWDKVKKISHQLFSSLERFETSWSNWDAIDNWLDMCVKKLNINSFTAALNYIIVSVFAWVSPPKHARLKMAITQERVVRSFSNLNRTKIATLAMLCENFTTIGNS